MITPNQFSEAKRLEKRISDLTDIQSGFDSPYVKSRIGLVGVFGDTVKGKSIGKNDDAPLFDEVMTKLADEFTEIAISRISHEISLAKAALEKIVNKSPEADDYSDEVTPEQLQALRDMTGKGQEADCD